jgi:flagellar biosynthetic protein FliO
MMQILETISALALVFGLLAGLYWISVHFKGKFGGNNSHRIHVTERVQLGDKRSLLLVQIGGRSYLLGATSNNISLLTPVEEEDLPKADTDEAAGPEADQSDSSFMRVLEMIR